ncbi:MAG: ferritin family protein [Leptospiraceae bacterium]|nr:ferritin family protein [Leptospiraceae bacterium]MCP5499758.1 ferritin family protein [Leptospiraceae bacterium]
MTDLKNTKLLDAIAASIQYEKDKFDFYLRAVEKTTDSALKKFFTELAEDVEEHIKVIQDFYKKIQGIGEFPNLKELNPIHKFHTSTIAKVMKRLDKITASDISSDELELVEKTLKAEDDGRVFYTKTKAKFKDPNLKLLFQKLANFSDENRTLIESHYTFLKEGKGSEEYYWEDDSLMKEASKGKQVFKKTAKKKVAKKKRS